MQNGQSNINDLFNADRIFNIPKYQRTYTWQEDNLKTFLSDIKNQRGDKPYFLGTFLFHDKQRKGDYEVLDIVDGQQRLTTLVIFMKIIIELLESEKSVLITNKTKNRFIKDNDGVYKLELENEDNSFLTNVILENGKISSYETPSQRNLHNAKVYFTNELKLFNLVKLEQIYDVIINANILNYVVNNISDATQIFELLNDRGRPLSNLEGIKSFLMYKIGSLNIKDHNQPINSIQDNIAAIYRIVEYNSYNENDILRYHTIAFEDVKTEDYNNPDRHIKNEINNLFVNEVDDVIIKERIVNYVSDLKESFEMYKKIRTNEEKIDEIEYLLMLDRLGPFYPFLLKTYKDDKGNLKVFVKVLYKFIFMSAFIGLQNRNEKLYKNIRDNVNLTSLFTQIVDDNWWNIQNRFRDSVNVVNYYEWINKNVIKYILVRYENHLRKVKGYPLLTRKNFQESEERTKLSIEHISAQKSNLNFSDTFNEKSLHSIGNLVIDTVSSNSRKGKKLVDEKMAEYKKAPIMSQNEIDESITNWQKKSEIKTFIEEREKKLTVFINDYLI